MPAKAPAGEPLHEIIKELGVLSENAKGWQTQLNLVSWGGKDPKYDIRPWSPDKSRMGKGVTLTEEEMNALAELWSKRDEEDAFD
jgi:hypothetical protein